jgi:thymidylate kinase
MKQNNKVLIIEGPDGGGKTTLANTLFHLKYRYFHEGPPPVDEPYKLHYYAQKLLTVLGRKRPVVFDRFHLGEMVYAPIARNDNSFGYAEMRIFNRLLDATGTQCLIAIPSFETCLENWKKKFRAGNDFLKNERKFMDSYHKFMGLTAYTGRVNYEDQEEYRRIVKHIGLYTGSKDWPQLPSGCLGSPQAKFLFVGEKANHSSLDLPFFGMMNSSGFINRMIWDAGFTENEIAFTNAKTITGESRELSPVFDALPNLQHVFCLGRIAEKAVLDEIQPPFWYSYVTHPSCLKRFHHSKREQVLIQLKKKREEILGRLK